MLYRSKVFDFLPGFAIPDRLFTHQAHGFSWSWFRVGADRVRVRKLFYEQRFNGVAGAWSALICLA
jgi:hypothetical protein